MEKALIPMGNLAEVASFHAVVHYSGKSVFLKAMSTITATIPVAIEIGTDSLKFPFKRERRSSYIPFTSTANSTPHAIPTLSIFARSYTPKTHLLRSLNRLTDVIEPPKDDKARN
jgi:hypothetical protein